MLEGKPLWRHLMGGSSQLVQIALKSYEVAQLAEIIAYRWIHGHVLRRENHYLEAVFPGINIINVRTSTRMRRMLHSDFNFEVDYTTGNPRCTAKRPLSSKSKTGKHVSARSNCATSPPPYSTPTPSPRKPTNSGSSSSFSRT